MNKMTNSTTAKKGISPYVIVLLVVIAVAIAVIMSTSDKSAKSSTFSQADADPTETVHINGHLMKDMPLEYNPEKDPNYFSFFLKDKEGEVRKVISLNPKQQDFERAETVNMYGKGTAEGKEFHATTVMPKCPSKYPTDSINSTAQTSSTLLK